MERKIVFFDIDGTLKPIQAPVPESTKAAVRALKANGHIAVVCTGRCKEAAIHQDFLKEMGLTDFICAAGNQGLYQGNSVFCNELPKDALRRIRAAALASGCRYVLEGPDHLYYEPSQEQDIVGFWGSFFNSKRMFLPLDPEHQVIQKGIMLDGSKLRGTEYETLLERDLDLLWYDWGDLVELVPKGISKATGIQNMLEYLNISRENTYAFGDGPNDIEMLDYVAHSVAMGNAPDHVKAHAEYVTGNAAENGIYEALVHFGLI